MAQMDSEEKAPRPRIRLVAADLDGTLLTPQGAVSERTLAAVRRLEREGIALCLATSRRWASTAPLATSLAMRGPLILYDGAIARDYPSGEVLSCDPLPRETAQAAVELLAAHSLRPIAQYSAAEGELLLAGPAPTGPDASASYRANFAAQVRVAPIAELADRDDALRVVAFGSARHLRQVAQADLGTSTQSGRPVSRDILERLPATLELTFAALFLGAGLGVLLGVLAAVHHNTWLDHALRVFTVGGVAIASFWFAIMLQLLFSMQLDLLPLRDRLGTAMTPPAHLTGLLLLDSLLTGRFDAFRDALRHLALPALTLSLGATATITRFTRSGVLETLQKEYVLYEIAAGYPRWLLIAVYVLRNSLVATITCRRLSAYVAWTSKTRES